MQRVKVWGVWWVWWSLSEHRSNVFVECVYVSHVAVLLAVRRSQFCLQFAVLLPATILVAVAGKMSMNGDAGFANIL